MRCSFCGFEGIARGGVCPRCTSPLVSLSSSPHILLSSPHPSVSQPLPPITLTSGDVVGKGRYRLVEPLLLPENKQGQGRAWAALDTRSSQQRVVLYQLRVPVAPQEQQEFSSRLAQLSSLGPHPNLPQVVDAFSEQGYTYVVQQYPVGERLATRMQRQNGALPEQVVAGYGVQLCSALSLLARQQPPLVHGAISPDTIVISPDDTRVLLIHLVPFPSHESGVRHEHAPAGYKAPEHVREGRIQPAGDLYSLAATLHQAITGYDPRERLAFFHPPARRLNPAVTPEMETILAKELRLSRAQRYAHPIDMQKDLSSVLAAYPPLSEPSKSSADPVRLSSAQQRALSRRRSLQSGGFLLSLCLLLLLSVLFVILPPALGFTSTAAFSNATATTTAYLLAQRTEQELEMQSFQKKGIGISDGRVVFDTFPGRSDVDLKKHAAQAIQQGDMSSAVTLLTKATTADPTDGEAQIYNENMHILQSGAPSVTIVLGVALASDPIYSVPGRAELEGAFLAQHEINSGNRLPHGLRLRLLIDSAGANDADVATVAQFVANRVLKAGNVDHILAVVGWPFSSLTLNAHDIITGAHLPLVSQTASSVKLSGISPYFFRVNPADDQQGKTLATLAVQQLHAKRILVLRDPTDPYSVSLADAFAAQVQKEGATAINTPDGAFTEATTTVASYQKVVNASVSNQADLIFLPGFDVDAVRLAHALGIASRATPSSTQLATLHILGGDAVDTNVVIGQGGGADAALANAYPQDMHRLIFTAFAHPDEWKIIGVGHMPPFFSDWSSTYQSSAVVTERASAPGNDAILTYDAVHVLITAATHIQGAVTGQSLRDALSALGKGKVPAFQGISGRILFDAQGNPVDKAIVVLDVEEGAGANAITLRQVAGRFR